MCFNNEFKHNPVCVCLKKTDACRDPDEPLLLIRISKVSKFTKISRTEVKKWLTMHLTFTSRLFENLLAFIPGVFQWQWDLIEILNDYSPLI